MHDNIDRLAFVSLANGIYIQRDVCLYLNCAKSDKRALPRVKTFLSMSKIILHLVKDASCCLLE